MSHESYSECSLQIPFIFMENSSGSELMNSDCGQGGTQLKGSCISWTHFWLQLTCWIFFFSPETSRQEVHKSTPKLGMASALCFSSLSNAYFFSPGWPQAHCVAEGDLDHWLLLHLFSKCWDYGAWPRVVYMVLGKDQGLGLVTQGCSLPTGLYPLHFTCVLGLHLAHRDLFLPIVQWMWFPRNYYLIHLPI